MGLSRSGRRVSTALTGTSYYRWVEAGRTHPGFDFAIIPDVIDGSEEENDDLMGEWPFFDGVPDYHLHDLWTDF
jgi:hypothetical protein